MVSEGGTPDTQTAVGQEAGQAVRQSDSQTGGVGRQEAGRIGQEGRGARHEIKNRRAADQNRGRRQEARTGQEAGCEGVGMQEAETRVVHRTEGSKGRAEVGGREGRQEVDRRTGVGARVGQEGKRAGIGREVDRRRTGQRTKEQVLTVGKRRPEAGGQEAGEQE